MLRIKKLTSAIGAEISGVDLTQPLDADMVAAIRTALLEHLVIFFRSQKKLTPDEHGRLARYFGDIEQQLWTPAKKAHNPDVLMLDQVDPGLEAGTANWHTDNTFRPEPPLGCILQAVTLPDVGGDTCWASMYAAYDALSEPMKRMLEGLTAVHDIRRVFELDPSKSGNKLSMGLDLSLWPPQSHPVVVEHPETGRKLLFVNKNWTTYIEGMSSAESDMLMRFLLEHVKHPAFQIRFQWREGDIAFWDNRSTQHLAVPDYTTRRVMQRMALAGVDRPSGPANRVNAMAAE